MNITGKRWIDHRSKIDLFIEHTNDIISTLSYKYILEWFNMEINNNLRFIAYATNCPQVATR